jgi:metal-responsive CopG/Arc/MetJ family transcriptional regulator
MRHNKDMTKNYRVPLSCTIKPELLRDIDSLKGQDVPRSRFVERALNQYVESRKKEKEVRATASSVVHAPEAVPPAFFRVNPGHTTSESPKETALVDSST